MQDCDVTVRLSGSLLHTVQKTKVTPAEIQVLRAVHGQDAVVDIMPTRINKRSHAVEFERLSAIYGSGNPLEPSDGGPSHNIVARCFPGVSPRLPVHLKDIGLGHLVVKGTSLPSALAKGENEDGEKLEDEDEDES